MMNATLKKFFSGWAMKLTILRVALIPLFIITYYFHPESWQQWLSLWVYTIACISDFLDGWLARHLKEESAFGAFLDPVADKLMVAAVLIVLVQQNPEIWLMLCALIVIGREIWISALREWMSGIGHLPRTLARPAHLAHRPGADARRRRAHPPFHVAIHRRRLPLLPRSDDDSDAALKRVECRANFPGTLHELHPYQPALPWLPAGRH